MTKTTLQRMFPPHFPIFLLLCSCGFVLAQTVTNTVTVPAPVDKFTELLNRVETVLTGILAVVSVLLGWWAQNRSKLAALVPPLIKSIESHGSDELKAQVSKAAGAIGVEPEMQRQVDLHTASPSKIEDPFKAPTVTIPALQNPPQSEVKSESKT